MTVYEAIFEKEAAEKEPQGWKRRALKGGVVTGALLGTAAGLAGSPRHRLLRRVLSAGAMGAGLGAVLGARYPSAALRKAKLLEFKAKELKRQAKYGPYRF